MHLPSYTVHVARSLDELQALRADWLGLEARAEGAIFFQSYEWSRNAAEHFTEHGMAELFIATVRDRGRLIGLLPLRLIRKRWRIVLTGLAEPFQEYSDLLLAPHHDPTIVFTRLLKTIMNSGADYMHLRQVRKGSSLDRALGTTIREIGEAKGAPFVPLGHWPHFNEYYKSVKSKTRKNMRNARNRLQHYGIIAHAVARNGHLLSDVISHTFNGRAKWLERMGLASQAFNGYGFEAFLDRFKSPKTSGVRTIAMSLNLNYKPIAEQWGFIHNERYYAYMSTMDTNFEHVSPGKLHLGEVIRCCFDARIAVADFLVPEAAYKLTWAADVTPVHDRVLPITLTGRLFSSAWLRVLRPLAKRFLLFLPPMARRTLFKATKSGSAANTAMGARNRSE